MARKSSGEGCGCLVVLIVFGVAARFYESHPTAVIACVGGVVLLFVLASILAAFGSRCDICKAHLKKTKYHIRVDGRKKTICPVCNRHVHERISKQAVEAFLNDGGD